ncbi:YqcC family protein [Halothiobacillus sp.]|uniref:YqcC family protein n=1 Tax=Halothiobacillus sp. TaxID=1891311 RepID=UPI002AD501A6|nr:YqcC family protein [Halothiobacillus sp.]
MAAEIHIQHSMEKPSRNDLLNHLRAIDSALFDAGLSSPQPSVEALSSTVPFCFDTLEFHAWLQWVFLPRMKQAVHEVTALPAACSIAPLAEYRFAEIQDYDTDELLTLLVQFDELATQYFLIQEEGCQ